MWNIRLTTVPMLITPMLSNRASVVLGDIKIARGNIILNATTKLIIPPLTPREKPAYVIGARR